MNKVYLDVTKTKNCPAICMDIEDTEVIKAGLTIYKMDSNDRNETYDQFANEYDIHFIFEDDIVELPFYTIPQVDIFATDGTGGLIGTIGSTTNLQSDFPICYITKNKECFLIANNGREFLESCNNWKSNLNPYNEITVYKSKLDAEKELKFINI